MRLFRRLARSRNPHLPLVNCGFLNIDKPQNSSPYTVFKKWGMALLASALLQNCSFTLSKLRVQLLRAVSK